ncbi:hypothetical protein NLJ89_g6651 [Agrocybe chaxingu]|uniref:Uncharacterized protein n=1 Tax=Agrocybe chaxingu TaxID=84603 RepID=A0A9W8MVT4_9AGAR|nr:hypothetical protein NLJ89_g6651 [Agrocybe chaxingu]
MLLYSAQTPSPHRLGSVQDDDFGGAIVPSQGLKEGGTSQRYEELWTSTSTWTSVPYPPTPCGNPPHVGADANDSSSTRASHLYDQHPHSWHTAQRLAQGGQPIVSAISPTLSNISPTGVTYQNQDVPPRLFWPAAHQPIPPEQRSPYSELAVNLAFLEKLKEEEKARALAALIAPPAPSSDTSSPRSADITVLPPALSNRNARAPPADKKHPAESPILSSNLPMQSLSVLTQAPALLGT